MVSAFSSSRCSVNETSKFWPEGASRLIHEVRGPKSKKSYGGKKSSVLEGGFRECIKV